jgi:hypothetical protein
VKDLYKEYYKALKNESKKTTQNGKISHAPGLVESA